MPPRSEAGDVPQWDALFADALGQAGYFTTRQAALRHVSARLLSHHLKSGRLDIAARSIFRFHQFPSEPHDELVPLWLWSGREGLFSHETALALRNLSDVLPVAFSRRRRDLSCNLTTWRLKTVRSSAPCLPELNHLFPRVKTGAPSEYPELEKSMDPSMIRTVVAWFAAHSTSAPTSMSGL